MEDQSDSAPSEYNTPSPEDVPESERDWHPRSNGQVLDLVHPSLYPIVYGRTLSYPEVSNDRSLTSVQVQAKPGGKKYYISQCFQWLPTDFEVSEDGTSAKSRSYINNLHIKHKDLYDAIERLIAAYIPLFERVLTDSITNVQTEKSAIIAIENVKSGKLFRLISKMGVRDWKFGKAAEKRRIKYTLGGRTIQVIAKLANIHLSPEGPEYAGGSWHVEGMKNEAIAASSIYCYDEENTTESRLAFRTAVADPESYEQEDEEGCILTRGIGKDDPCVNELGSVITCQNRCIAFPNVYQHRVSPFQLADKSNPGHRKMIALFLVDPAIHRPPTTTVPPQ